MSGPETSTAPGRGAGSSQTNAGKETGVPPKEARLHFSIEVTAAMRGAETKRARHALLLATALGQPSGPWKASFNALPDDQIGGLAAPIPETETRIDYWILQSFFLRMADGRAMKPYHVAAIDGQSVADPLDIWMAVNAGGAYRERKKALEGLQLSFLAGRLDPVLKRIANMPGADTDFVRDIYAQADRISEKIGRLDPHALLGLIERQGPPPEKIEFTRANVRRALRNLEWEIDWRLSNTETRASDFARLDATLREALAGLDGFGPGWRLKRKLDMLRTNPLTHLTEPFKREAANVERAIDSAMRGTEAARELTEKERLDRDARQALRAAGATPFFEIADLEGRTVTYIKALGRTLPIVARRHLAELRAKVEDARNRGHLDLEALYKELDTLIPSNGLKGLVEAGAKTAELRRLEKRYPLMGYPALASHALSLFLKWRNPKKQNWTMSRASRFAHEMNSDLYYKWRRPALKAEEYFREKPYKAWLADKLIDAVLTENKLEPTDFRREIAHIRAADEADDTSILDWIITLLSIALAFVPGGAIITAARAAVAGYDAYSLYAEQIPDFAARSALYDIGFTDREPSAFGLYLAIVAHGTDVVEIGKLLRIPDGELLEAARKGEMEALFKRHKITRREILKAYRKQQRKELKEAFGELAERAFGPNRMGMGVSAALEEVAGAVELMARMGFSKGEDIADGLRLIFGQKIPSKTLEKAMTNARARIANAVEDTDFETIFQSVQRLTVLEQRLARVNRVIKKRQTLPNTKKNRLETRRWMIERAAIEADLKTARAVKNIVDHRIAEIEENLAYISAFYKNWADRGYDWLKVPRGPQLRRGAALKAIDLEAELKTLRRIRAGQAPTAHGRQLLYELRVNDWLWRRTGNATKHRVMVEVEFEDGVSRIVEVDTLMLTETGAFRIYDAKWTDRRLPRSLNSSEPGAAARRRAYLKRRVSRSKKGDPPSPQEEVYPRLARGVKIKKARLTEPKAQRFFFKDGEIPDDGVIELEQRIVFVLGDNSSAFNLHDLVD